MNVAGAVGQELKILEVVGSSKGGNIFESANEIFDLRSRISY